MKSPSLCLLVLFDNAFLKHPTKREMGLGHRKSVWGHRDQQSRKEQKLEEKSLDDYPMTGR